MGVRTVKSINDSAGFEKLNIYNIALSKIGSERIQLDNTSTANEILTQCNLHYAPALSELSRMHAFNCCIAHAELTVDNVAPVFGFARQSPVGASAERIIEAASDPSATGIGTRKERFKIGSFIDTDDNSYEKPSVEHNNADSNDTKLYVTILQTPAVNEMDGIFFSALTTYLASKLAVPVAGDFNRQFELIKYLYEVILPEARKVSAVEGLQQSEIDFKSGFELPNKPFTYQNYERV
tara:strand:- start:215 stop:928 length:714 start_codon:yes stop_codon:yes gene_type:complete